jgi:SNF2 family DNA or RNA helicase
MRRVAYAPHPYQKKAIKFLLERSAAALLLSPGLGKTSIAYAALKVLKNKGVFKGALVVAPLRPAYSVWPKESEKWTEFKDFSVGILHGKDKLDVLNEVHDVYVINFEGLEWLLGDPKLIRQLLKNVDTLIIDELSKLKHSSTKRFKLLKPWLGKFTRRWGLTGSPAANGLMGLFGQCYVLDLGRALGPYITHYRNKYFYSTGYGGYTWSLQDGAAEKIYKAVKPLALTMEAEDYLDMPQIIQVPVYVELPEKARKLYDAMEAELFAELGEKMFVASTAAAASIKCEQIANGALYDDLIDATTGLPIRGKRQWVELHTTKLDALEEVLGELQGQPSLWAYHFGHDLERILAKLGKDTPHMAVHAKEADKLIVQWNLNKLDYLFGHPASIGHGLNLQEGGAHHVGFLHIPWDYDLYDQYIRRLRRQGNKSQRVFVYHIVARGTVDEAKMIALRSKAKGQGDLFNALKSYRASRK